MRYQISRSLESYNVVIGGVMEKMEWEKGLMKSIRKHASKTQHCKLIKNYYRLGPMNWPYDSSEASVSRPAEQFVEKE